MRRRAFHLLKYQPGEFGARDLLSVKIHKARHLRFKPQRLPTASWRMTFSLPPIKAPQCVLLVLNGRKKKNATMQRTPIAIILPLSSSRMHRGHLAMLQSSFRQQTHPCSAILIRQFRLSPNWKCKHLLLV